MTRKRGPILSIIAMGLMLIGCRKTEMPTSSVDCSDFRSGDIIFRCGRGLESKVVTAFSQGDYSHIGLLYEKEGQWYVIHAVPGEAPQGEPEYLKCEAIADFLHEDKSIREAWGRIDCSDELAQEAARYAMSQVEQKKCFDNDYSIDDTTRYYCSELVWQSYLRQGIDIAQKRTEHQAPVGLKTDVCIYPKDIETDPHMLFVKTIFGPSPKKVLGQPHQNCAYSKIIIRNGVRED